MDTVHQDPGSWSLFFGSGKSGSEDSGFILSEPMSRNRRYFELLEIKEMFQHIKKIGVVYLYSKMLSTTARIRAISNLLFGSYISS